ncbi:hypothetical protein GGX14DRAFT_403618 [Mycena pura]|nr:hypothetical protein GGX14DRAFT_403618 [Mycena pura]
MPFSTILFRVLVPTMKLMHQGPNEQLLALSLVISPALPKSQTVFNIILGGDHKQMPTEQLSHVAAALCISISGKRNLRLKLPASIRKILTTLQICLMLRTSILSPPHLLPIFSNKVYHIYIERLRILDKGYAQAWIPSILPSPSAPSTP